MTCPDCDGDGFVVTCCDDMCRGVGECMHGDGESVCETCHGDGEIVAPTPGSGRWRRRFVWFHMLSGLWTCEDPLTSLVAVVRRRKRGVDWQVKRADYDQDTVLTVGAAHSITAAKRCAINRLFDLSFAGGVEPDLEGEEE